MMRQQTWDKQRTQDKLLQPFFAGLTFILIHRRVCFGDQLLQGFPLFPLGNTYRSVDMEYGTFARFSVTDGVLAKYPFTDPIDMRSSTSLVARKDDHKFVTTPTAH